MAVGILMPQPGGSSDFFRTDFSSYTIGAPPGDWTQWASSGAANIVASAGSLSGKAFAFANTGTGSNTFTWNRIPRKADYELLTRFRQQSSGDTKPITAIFVRGQSLADGSQTLYQSQVRYRTASVYDTSVYIRRYLSGSQVDLASPDGPAPMYNGGSPTAWLWNRTRIVGTNILSKVWQQGQPEPGAWLINVTDANITGLGYCGIFVSGGAPIPEVQCDYFSVAINGKTAL
jgi:hypothetical protein